MDKIHGEVDSVRRNQIKHIEKKNTLKTRRNTLKSEKDTLKKLDRILGGGLLDLKGSRELRCGLELAGKGFEAVDDVFRSV